MFLMIGLPWDTWLRLFIWWAIGLIIYFAYGRSHSTLTTTQVSLPKTPLSPGTASY
jgi:basic amino acid/polyamine antiporter, APA family